MKIWTAVVGGAIVLLACGCGNQSNEREFAEISQGTFEQPGQRYINPLSIEESANIADPTVLRFKGTYYLFLTGGMVWSSLYLPAWARLVALVTPAMGSKQMKSRPGGE